ncbi:MAG: SDR family NAD(P)-dependent oxidoreductase [Desulfovibrionaceae bacterium]|nr:SDR family NAD(P)-dependent oxidoreductase [Desulfovibrionaceae bacterium]
MNACITLPIAIIGVGLRLPGGVTSLDSLWSVLKEGRDCITPIPDWRFNCQRFYHPNRTHPGTSVTMQAGLIENIYDFDADFFGISPKEAEAMDPQQRLLLELTWEALEDAAIKPSSLSGSDTAVYVGAASPDGGTSHADDIWATSPYSMTGTNLSIIANRISYIFNFHGPSFTLDTACSSSIYALHAACQTLASGGASLAIAAGANVLLAPYPLVGFSQAYMLSPDGRCKVFDAHGNGYVRAEGAGVLILEPLDLALANHHPIRAVIRGIGCNSDGRTQGIALPSGLAQEELLKNVYAAANCDPKRLTYLEAHGTGTLVGDPIEATAIGHALGVHRDNPLTIGSIKANIGHLETASGMAGIMKALVIMRERMIPKQIQLTELNPDIDFEKLNIHVPQALEPIETTSPITIGVNSFGFGGANGHVILEEFVPASDPKSFSKSDSKAVKASNITSDLDFKSDLDAKDLHSPKALPPLCLQAKSEASLQELARISADFIAKNAHDYPNIAANFAHRSEDMPYRLVAEAESLDELGTTLRSELSNNQNLVLGQTNLTSTPKTAFVFAGNGCHWQGMGQDLLAHPTFRKRAREVADLFLAYTDVDFFDLLSTATASDLEKTELTQPLIFLIQVAICALLEEEGLKPDVVLGHSVGEVAAVWAAGLLSLADAVKVVYFRSLYQGKTSGLGQMAAAKLTIADALTLAKTVGLGEVEIAGINAPASLTLSGSARGLEAMAVALAQKRTFFKLLPLDYAFHSRMMETIKDDLAKSLQGLTTLTPRCTFISTVSECASDDLASCGLEPLVFDSYDADYWWRNIRRPVNFARACQKAISLGVRCFLEISPHAILQQYLRSIAKSQGVSVYVGSTMQRKADNVRLLERAWKQAWVHGWPIDLATHVGLASSYSPLPHYPWHRQYLRLAETPESLHFLLQRKVHPLLGYRTTQDVFENELDLATMPWLGDHRVGSACFYPAACYLEMTMAAGLAKYGSDGAIELLNTAILRPIIFDTERSIKVKTSVESLDGEVRIFSRPLMQETDWVLQARGRVIKSGAIRPPKNLIVLNPEGFGEKIPVTTFYALTQTANMNYGPVFRPIEAIWQNGDQVLAKLLPQDQCCQAAEEGMNIAPNLLDAGLQLIFQAIAEYVFKIKAPRLPYWFDRCVLYKAGRVAYALLSKDYVSVRNVVCTLTLLDDAGETLLTLYRGRARTVERLGQADLLKFYTTSFLPASLEADEPNISADLFNGVLTKLSLAKNEAQFSQKMQARLEENLLLDACALAILRDFAASETQVEQIAFQKYLHKAIINSSDLFADLPPFEVIWQTLFSDYPKGSCENTLLLATSLSLKNPQSLAITSDLLHAYLADLAATYEPLFAAIFKPLLAAKAADTTIKVLFWGASALNLGFWQELLGQEEVTIADCDQNLLDRIKNALQGQKEFSKPNVELLDLEKEPARTKFKVIVLCQSLHLATDIKTALKNANASLTDDGLLILVEPVPSLFLDLAHGFDQNWFAASQNTEEPVGRLLSADTWASLLQEAGFSLGSNVANASGKQAAQDNNANLTLWVAQKSLSPSQKSIDAPHRQRTSDDSVSAVQITQAEAENTGESKNIEISKKDSNVSCETIDNVAQSQKESQKLILWDAEATPDEIRLALADKFDLVNFSLPEDLRLLKNATCQACSCQDLGSQTAANQDLGAQACQSQTTASQAKCFDFANLSSKLLNLGLDLKATPIIASFAGENTLEDAITLTARFTHLAKTLPKDREVKIILLTFGGQVLEAEQTASLSSAAVIGAARVLMNEQPNCKLKIIDLPKNLDLASVLACVREICANNKESEVILRGAKRYILRTHKVIDDFRLASNLRLEALDPGHLESLTWVEDEKKKPSCGQVLVQMAATGLNFRDVMWAMNLLPEEALEQGFSGPGLGIEGAGTICGIGDGVSDLKVGDRVVCFGSNCFQNYVLTNAQACAKIPAHWDFAEAATIPVTFFTAYYALKHLGRLQKGESILIHGAAGGVGLAAIQIAQTLGLEIYATAGSPLKRELLATLGIKHIYDSRSLAFKDEILAQRNGLGLDAVLNSLAGEALRASLDLLAPFGRFLELGKSDFYADAALRMRPFRNNITYFGIDVDQLMREKPLIAQQLFLEMMADFEDNSWHALPCTFFASNDVEQAFRLMQKSKHLGKIVVAPPTLKSKGHLKQESVGPKDLDHALKTAAIQVTPNASYLISGGLAGFGLATAKHLVDLGAKHLILVSRSGETDANHADLEALRSQNVSVLALACDVSNEARLRDLLDQKAKDMPAIRGIIHAAANLKDALIDNLSLDYIEKSLTPKIGGALALDAISRDLTLDFFIVYSSVTTLLGNPGQANYVAANLAMENLMARRRNQGLPGLAIGWGAIADYGMLTRDAKTRASIQDLTGMQPIEAKIGLELLTNAKPNYPMLSLFAADFQKLARLAIAKQMRFSPLILEEYFTHANQSESLAKRVAGLSAEEAHDLVLDEVLLVLARILRTNPKTLRASQPLQEMGLDSLMGVELTLGLEDLLGGKSLGTSLNSKITAEELTLKILQTLASDDAKNDPLLDDLAASHGIKLTGQVAAAADAAKKIVL